MYRLGKYKGQPYIECAQCGMRSFHSEDIKHKFCAKCNNWHDYWGLGKENLSIDEQE
jgi:ribosomal protein L37E